MAFLVLLLLGLFVWWAFGGLRRPGSVRGDASARRTTGEVPRGGAAPEGAVLADLRAARAAGAREGFQVGLKQGRAEGYTEAMRQVQAQARSPGRARVQEAGASTARPRTRAEALRVLDLPDAATFEQVEERYRQLRRSAHPDNFPSTKYPKAFTELAEAEFKRLGEARDLLVR